MGNRRYSKKRLSQRRGASSTTRGCLLRILQQNIQARILKSVLGWVILSRIRFFLRSPKTAAPRAARSNSPSSLKTYCPNSAQIRLSTLGLFITSFEILSASMTIAPLASSNSASELFPQAIPPVSPIMFERCAKTKHTISRRLRAKELMRENLKRKERKKKFRKKNAVTIDCNINPRPFFVDLPLQKRMAALQLSLA